MNFLFLCLLIPPHFFYQPLYYPPTKASKPSFLLPLKSETSETCENLSKGDCMLEDSCGWCIQKAKCVFAQEKVIQYCKQLDTYVFGEPEQKYDVYSYNHNVHYDSEKGEILVHGEQGESELDVTQDLPGITVKTRRK